MINDVNDLQEQQEIIKNSKLCDLLSVQNAVKNNIEVEALEIVQNLLREEGIEYDQEHELYYDVETGEAIDVDI